MLLWAVASPSRLSATAAAAITAPGNELFVSAATAWEIAIKQALGRLRFPLDDFHAILAQMRAEPLPILPNHAIAAGRLPRYHGDPFDRVLVAQAQVERLVLVSGDAAMARYEVSILNPKAS